MSKGDYVRQLKEEYDICKEACKEEGCYCPREHIFHGEKANVPCWVRVYHERVGYLKALDEHNILHGKAAEKFLKDMKDREAGKISKKNREFLQECVEIYEEGKKCDSHIENIQKETEKLRKEIRKL